MKVDVSQFHDAFFEEAAEHLAAMEQLLVTLDIDSPDAESLNGIFRAAHSIKGGAGIFGFPDLVDVTHVLESLLDKVRSGKLALRAEMIDAVLAARDVLERLLDHHRRGTEATAQERDEAAAIGVTLEALTAASVDDSSTAIDDEGFGLFDTAPAASDDDFGFFDEPAAPADDSFGLFDSMPTPITADDGFGLFADALDPLNDKASAPQVKPAPEIKPVPETKPVPRGEPTPASATRATGDSGSIRVSVEKADQLINMVGELVITQSMLAQLISGLDANQHDLLFQAVGQLERNTRDLQEAAMSMRMLPIGTIFSRFPRVVRDTAARLGKQVELVIEGEGTELDKGLIEKLSDPLTHLVRNAIDHGIEMPDARAAAGKSVRGRVLLKGSHQSGNVVIEITDDGHGLNREKILSKARERGFSIGADMPDADVWALIFEPGFSTADAVTDISGRGVGMDVVRRNITALGGRIEIESFTGVGSRFTIWLPLTLAILDGMLVAVDGETYVVPLTNVIESLQSSPAAISRLPDHGHVIRVRDEYIPLASLRALLSGAAADGEPSYEGIVVIVEAEGRKFALCVDELTGQSQVVIKSLETNYRRIAGFAGATILGNGRVAMILDVDALRRMYLQTAAATLQSAG